MSDWHHTIKYGMLAQHEQPTSLEREIAGLHDVLRRIIRAALKDGNDSEKLVEIIDICEQEL